MTTDHDNKRVSDTYRELAREETPARLDDHILAMATRESRSRYGLARAWIRPVAWAAMIGISLAFMLEMTWFTDVPRKDGVPQPPVSGERLRQDGEVTEPRHEDSLHQPIAEQADAAIATTPPSPSGEAKSPAAAIDELEPALAVEKVALPGNAEKRARLQAVSEPEEAAAVNFGATDADRSCDSEARTSADGWYACIRELRDRGLDDEASAELEALLRAFPDFREPPAE